MSGRQRTWTSTPYSRFSIAPRARWASGSLPSSVDQPTPEERAAFESLLTRVGRDTSEREQLQASLSRLRHCDGDAWWLTQSGVVYTKPSDYAFPFLGVAAPVTLLSSSSGHLHFWQPPF